MICLVCIKGGSNIRCTTIDELAAVVAECEAKGKDFALEFRSK